MRAVPHRVVCLLGLDDGVFPRRVVPDGDDLTGDDPRVGDPDPRGEDRQLLLDALTSATDTLVVLYTGTDPRNGDELRPAVPVDALLDTLDRTVATAPDGPSGAVAADRPGTRCSRTARPSCEPPPRATARRSASTAARCGRPRRRARAAGTGARSRTRPWCSTRCRRRRDVELADALPLLPPPRPRAAAGAGPALRRRATERVDEQIPVELDGLQRWAVGDRMLQAHLAGVAARGASRPPSGAAARSRRARLGQRLVRKLSEDVASVAAAAAPVARARRPSGSTSSSTSPTSGSAAAWPACAATPRSGSLFSRPSAKHRLQAWVELLALTLARPDRAWRAVVVGRGGAFELGPVPADVRPRRARRPRRRSRARGCAAVLPFAPETS